MAEATRRRLSFALAIVSIVACSSTPDAAMEPGATHIVMLSEEEVVKPPPAYAKIPGFKFNFDSHPANVRDGDECKNVCNSQPTCKSYSYAARLNVCEWSTSKMQYDPDFVFNFKPANGGAYHQFPGLVYRATGWLKSEGKTMQECAALCDRAAACAAFSYRGRDKLCLLSGHAVGFHEDFNYYEKEGPHQEFALRPKDSPAPAAAPAAAPNAAAGPSPASVVTAAVQAAQAALAPGGAVHELHQAIQGGEPPSVVAERLQAVKDWAASKIKQQEEETQLKLRAAQVDNEAAMEKQKATDEQKEADSEIERNKADAEKSAEEQAEDAKKKADDMVAKVKFEAQEASVTAEMSQAAAEKHQAQATVEKAEKEVRNIKELDEKKDEQYKGAAGEAAQKKTNEDMQVTLIHEKDGKKTAITVKTEVAEANAAVRTEMSGKTRAAIETTMERNTKMVDEERARKSTRAISTHDDATRITNLQDSNKELADQLHAANKKIADALLSESTTKAEMKFAVDKAKGEEYAQVAANEAEAKQTASAATQQAELARERSDEQLRKSSRVHTDMEFHSKEALQKGSEETDSCKTEYTAMENTARAEETTVAATASSMPGQAGADLLAAKKEEWRQKLETKWNACLPQKVEFSVKVAPTASASVSAPRPQGPDREEVSLLSLEEDPAPPALTGEQTPDPWPLDRPVPKMNSDGSVNREDYADDAARLRESNAATERGMQNIESGAAEQVAFYKFSIAQLKSGEVVKSSALTFRKEGGPESACVVKLTSCDYNPNELSYNTRPEIINTLSDGGIFPQADGEVNIPLSSDLITGYLTNTAAAEEHAVCVELSGGQANQAVTVNEVNLQMKIEKDPTVEDTSSRRRRTLPPIEVARRRRSELPVARRRRSVQAVKDEAQDVYKRVYDQYRPIYEEQMQAKIPYTVASAKMDIQRTITAQQPAILQQAIQVKLEQNFNKDEAISAQAERNKQLTDEALETTFPAQYATKKLQLANTMKTDLQEKLTAEANSVMNAEAKTYADDKTTTDAQSLLDNAISRRVSEKFPAALQVEVQKNLPNDYSQAIQAILVNTIETETEAAVALQVTNKQTSELNTWESVGTDISVAQALAVSAATAPLTIQAIATEVARIKASDATEDSSLKDQLNGNNAAQKTLAEATIRDTIADRVPADSLQLTATARTALENNAKETEIEAKKAELFTHWNNYYRESTRVTATAAQVKTSEEARLEPIVKADIIKNLEADLGPAVRTALTTKEADDVNAQKATVMARIHAALVEEKKAALTPAKDAKLVTTISEAESSAQFVGEVEAAQLELKEKLKDEMGKAIRAPLMKASEIWVKSNETAVREQVTTAVTQEQDQLMQTRIAEATTDDQVLPGVKKELEAKMHRDLKKKVMVETRKAVDEELGDKLKQCVDDKYGEATLSNAMGFVRQHRMGKIREEETAKIKAQVSAQVAETLPSKSHELLTQTTEQLYTNIYNDKKQTTATALQEQINGLDETSAAAVELAHDNQIKIEANTQAAAQAQYKMTRTLEPQLKAQMTTQAEAALMPTLESKVEARVNAEAEEISKKALKRKYDDDLGAMELGKNHVPPAVDHEQTPPNVIDASSTVSTLATAGAANTNNGGTTTDDPPSPSPPSPPSSPANATAAPTPSTTPAPTNASANATSTPANASTSVNASADDTSTTGSDDSGDSEKGLEEVGLLEEDLTSESWW